MDRHVVVRILLLVLGSVFVLWNLWMLQLGVPLNAVLMVILASTVVGGLAATALHRVRLLVGNGR